MRMSTTLLLSLLLCATAVAQSGEPLVLQDDWFTLSIGGARAGHARTRLEQVEREGETLFRLVESGHMSLGRLGATVEIRSESVHLERADGTLVSSSSQMDMSNRESFTRVEFRDGRAWIEATVAGRTRKYDRECPEDAIGPTRARELVRERLDEPGARLELTVWYADLADFTEFDVLVVGPETVEIAPGDRRELVRVDTEIERLGLRITAWYGDDGREARSLMIAAGMEIAGLRTTREEALAATEDSDTVAPEVFTATMVVEPFFLPDARRATRAVVELRPRGDESGVPIPESERQRVLSEGEDGSRILELRALSPVPGMGGRRPLVEPAAELEPFLAASSAIQCDDERIRAAAVELVGEEADAWRAARILERWVEANVTEKSLDVGFASALEVFEDRAGDCSEHAVLLCALCRAAGIPARVAMGLLYIGGAWAGHAWNEVWIDGRWYAVDGTLGLGGADALRLTLSTMALDDESGGEEFAGLIANIGNLDLRVLELDTGRRVRPAADHGRMIGDEYVDELFGLRLRLPDGMEARVKRPEPGIAFDLLEAEGRSAEGPELRLAVQVFDASPEGGWPSFLGTLSGEESSLDGRPALRVNQDTDAVRRILVRSGTTVFAFVFRGVHDANAASVDAILASVDFDL